MTPEEREFMRGWEETARHVLRCPEHHRPCRAHGSFHLLADEDPGYRHRYAVQVARFFRDEPIAWTNRMAGVLAACRAALGDPDLTVLHEIMRIAQSEYGWVTIGPEGETVLSPHAPGLEDWVEHGGEA